MKGSLNQGRAGKKSHHHLQNGHRLHEAELLQQLKYPRQAKEQLKAFSYLYLLRLIRKNMIKTVKKQISRLKLHLPHVILDTGLRGHHFWSVF